MNKDLIFVTV